MTTFREMAYASPEAMVFGRAVHPVQAGFGLTVGDGEVVPELKYAPRPGTEASFETLREEYLRIARDALDRAVAIGLPALLLELEHVFQLTAYPEWGRDIAHETKWLLKEYHDKYGLRGALRATIADIRKPEHGMRDSAEARTMVEAFRLSAEAGADFLSIETIGGKEVFNHCVTRHDIVGVLFAVGVLGSLDMAWIWDQVVSIAQDNQVIAAGDTDCAHSNTAMFLAGGLLDNQLSHTFAALVRAAGAARSLVAFERGAQGPDKDCGYEGPILKAITGFPISMEGKASACAHSDLMGNLAAAVCDCWSNEAVQYGEMFGGTTPQVFTEILGYDVAQMNTALELGAERTLRDIFVASDKYRDPQAFVISPEIAYQLGEAIIAHGDDYYARSLNAMRTAATAITGAGERLPLTKIEASSLDRATAALEALGDDADSFIGAAIASYREQVPEFDPASYGL